MQADPESIPANDLTHELSRMIAHAGMDSGSASELEPTIFAGSEAGQTLLMLETARNDKLGGRRPV